MTRDFRIRRLAASEAREATAARAAVLADCVAGGASVSFMAGLTLAASEAFWRDEVDADDGRAILVAEDGEGIFGVVQVIPVSMPFQPHRVVISMLLVHRRGRRRGAAEALMAATEEAARAMGRWLLVL